MPTGYSIKKTKKKRKAKKEAEISSWGNLRCSPRILLLVTQPPRYSLPEGPLILSWTMAFELSICAANSHTKNYQASISVQSKARDRFSNDETKKIKKRY